MVYKGPIGVQLSDALDEANLMKRLSGLANALSELTEDNIEEVLEAFENSLSVLRLLRNIDFSCTLGTV